MINDTFINLSFSLDRSGLVWHPEIGDEVVSRSAEETKVSLLLDPKGYALSELRDMFVWLPTLEQLILQIEAREAFLFHAGIGQGLRYEAVVKTASGIVEVCASTLRTALGLALQDLLQRNSGDSLH